MFWKYFCHFMTVIIILLSIITTLKNYSLYTYPGPSNLRWVIGQKYSRCNDVWSNIFWSNIMASSNYCFLSDHVGHRCAMYCYGAYHQPGNGLNRGISKVTTVLWPERYPPLQRKRTRVAMPNQYSNVRNKCRWFMDIFLYLCLMSK